MKSFRSVSFRSHVPILKLLTNCWLNFWDTVLNSKIWNLTGKHFPLSMDFIRPRQTAAYASFAIRCFESRPRQHVDIDSVEAVHYKKRGLDTSSLSYFPYRDDGFLLHSVIGMVAKQYVKQYYKSDTDVKNDFELQNFMNEVSADGIGSDGGNGNVKDLPRKLTTVKSLVDFLTRFLWQISGQHAAVNYPLADYAAFTLNTPSKLYHDSRVANNVFSLYNYPNAKITAQSSLLAFSLANYRYDSLFDYGSQLPDKPGREVISRWYNFLQQSVQPHLEKRNLRRLRKGHLTYPYFLPRWIPNGIQT